MSDRSRPSPEVLALPLEIRVEMALKAAVEKVVLEHARDGRPLYVLEDGKVVAIPADELLKETP